jgi:hypothetical protein
VQQKRPNARGLVWQVATVRMLACLIVPWVLVGARPVAGQCPDPHYRWTEKTRESLASVTPLKRSINTILGWATLEFTGESRYKCAPRKGHELQVYSVLGWVRRVKTGETDGDWHIELTARADSDTGSCIVAEIPPVELGGNYAQARTDLQSLVTWDSQHGDVIPPVRLRFIGAAFFDGDHRGNATHRDQTDGGHGRCDSSAQALWELHPVYWVRQP